MCAIKKELPAGKKEQGDGEERVKRIHLGRPELTQRLRYATFSQQHQKGAIALMCHPWASRGLRAEPKSTRERRREGFAAAGTRGDSGLVRSPPSEEEQPLPSGPGDGCSGQPARQPCRTPAQPGLSTSAPQGRFLGLEPVPQGCCHTAGAGGRRRRRRERGEFSAAGKPLRDGSNAAAKIWGI